MDRATRANLRRLGFTSREITAIDVEQREFRATQAPKALSAAAEKQRRYRARKRAEDKGNNIPGWARRRVVDDDTQAV